MPTETKSWAVNWSPTLQRRRPTPRWPALLLLLCTHARADHGEVPLRVNQYLRFQVVSSSEVRLSYAIFLGVLVAMPYRQEADRDHNGRLDEAEQRALGQRLASELAQRLDLSLDGRRATLHFDEVRTALDGDAVGPWAFSLHLGTSLYADAGARHRVRLRGVVPLPPLGEASVWVSEQGQGQGRLLSGTNVAWNGAEATAHYYGVDGSDRPLSFTFAGRGRSWSAVARMLVRGAMALGVGIMIVGVTLLFRRPKNLQARSPVDED